MSTAVGYAWGMYYRRGMSSEEAQAFKAGYAAAEKANEARELHHFGAEQALANIKAYLDSGDFDEHDDTEQRDNILAMIPKDI